MFPHLLTTFVQNVYLHYQNVNYKCTKSKTPFHDACAQNKCRQKYPWVWKTVLVWNVSCLKAAILDPKIKSWFCDSRWRYFFTICATKTRLTPLNYWIVDISQEGQLSLILSVNKRCSKCDWVTWRISLNISLRHLGYYLYVSFCRCRFVSQPGIGKNCNVISSWLYQLQSGRGYYKGRMLKVASEHGRWSKRNTGRRHILLTVLCSVWGIFISKPHPNNSPLHLHTSSC